jgi:ribosome-associated protein
MSRLCTVCATVRTPLTPASTLIPRPTTRHMQQITFEVRGEFITLDRLLKATGIADSGGRAKTLVAEGRVQVDGQDESRKTAKIRPGQVVSLTGVRIKVVPEAAGSADNPGD